MSDMRKDKEQTNFSSADMDIYPRRGHIKVAGIVIRLGPVNMQVLMTLIENQGQVVSRAKLFDKVWKNQVVSDDTLTRCISDIRLQLGQHSGQDKLIETLPKRGYQWLPEVAPIVDNKQLPESSQKKKFIYWLMVSIIGLSILSTTVLWIANSVIRADQVRIALMPIQTKQTLNQSQAADVEDMLRMKILKTSTLKLLSSSVYINQSETSFDYLSREFNAQWIIEGRIRSVENKTRISLSLVDARTALVIHTLVQDVESSDLNNFCNLFIADMLKLLQ